MEVKVEMRKGTLQKKSVEFSTFSDIESISQFIYLGEAKFYEERMNEFCHVK